MTGFLKYIKQIGIDKFVATITQDDQKITVTIAAAAPTAERAKTMVSGMNGIISIGKMTAKNPSTERTLLDGAQVTSDGKKMFLLNFAIPKQVAQDMITKALQDAIAKKQAQPQPSSESGTKGNSNVALRQ
ncbi:MAG: hypothetical protein JO314_12530 [Acidobacteria bacterium]|nr:hypothetical protein [Acidobacteriota bacterium]